MTTNTLVSGSFERRVSIIVVLVVVVLTPPSAEYRCKPLLEGVLQKYCQGFYPREVAIKYDDRWVRSGQPFSVYLVNNETNRFFVSFDLNAVQKCNQLRYSNGGEFKCVSTGAVIRSKFNRLYCFQMNLQLVDDLLRFCKRLRGTGRVAKNVFAALQYTNQHPHSAAARGSAYYGCLLLTATLLTKNGRL